MQYEHHRQQFLEQLEHVLQQEMDDASEYEGWCDCMLAMERENEEKEARQAEEEEELRKKYQWFDNWDPDVERKYDETERCLFDNLHPEGKNYAQSTPFFLFAIVLVSTMPSLLLSYYYDAY